MASLHGPYCAVRPLVVVISTGFRWRQCDFWFWVFLRRLLPTLGPNGGGEKGGISWDLGGLGGYKLGDQLA